MSAGGRDDVDEVGWRAVESGGDVCACVMNTEVVQLCGVIVCVAVRASLRNDRGRDGVRDRRADASA